MADPDLVDDIYEAAAVPGLWTGVLDRIARIAGAEGTILFVAAPGPTRWIASPSVAAVMAEFVGLGWDKHNHRRKRQFRRLRALHRNLRRDEFHGGPDPDAGDDHRRRQPHGLLQHLRSHESLRAWPGRRFRLHPGGQREPAPVQGPARQRRHDPAILDFGAASPSAATFSYNTSTKAGLGFGGMFSNIAAREVDEIRGTTLNDAFTATGNTGIVLKGLGGNDTYVVSFATHVVDELVYGSGGIDTVQSSVTFNMSSVAQAKGAVDHLTLTGLLAVNGTGNGLANTIIGNAANNTLTGLVGNDTLSGGAGTTSWSAGPAAIA